MNIVTALAITIGVLAVAATYLCLGTGFGLQIWALFIGWGSFFHTGGKMDGFVKSTSGLVWGVVVAAIALFIIGTVAGSVLVTSIIVGVTVAILVLGAHIPALATIPAGVYGYASTAAFLLLTGVALGEMGAVISAALMIAISLIIGGLFGVVSEKAAGALTSSD